MGVMFPVCIAAELCLCSALAGVSRHRRLPAAVRLQLRRSVMGVGALISIPAERKWI